MARVVPARTPSASDFMASERTQITRNTQTDADPRFSASSAASSSSPEQLTRNHHALDLGRPLADRQKLRIAPVLLDRVVLDVPVAAMNLDRLFRDAHANLGRIELRHRGLARRRMAGIL